MRFIVCGGRDFKYRGLVFTELDHLHTTKGIDRVIHGCAPGADTFADDWARERGIPYARYKADWDDLTAPGAVIKTRRDGTRYNAKAGHDRNQLMIDDSDPDGVVASPVVMIRRT